MPKTKYGAPKRSPDQINSVVKTVQMTPSDSALLARVAEVDRRSKSDVMRVALRAYAAEVLGEGSDGNN